MIKASFKSKAWPKFLKDIKRLVIKSIPKKHELRDCIVDELTSTDRFHPSDCEYDLNELLKYSQDFEGFSDLAYEKKEIQEELSSMAEEIQTRITDHYKESLNFDPAFAKDIVKIKIKLKKVKPSEIKTLLKHFKFEKVKNAD
jgi:hypothetical protein